MQGYVKVAELADVPEDEPCYAEHEGTPLLVLLKRQGQVYALHNDCPHRSGPLAEGELEDGKIRCPWHGALIDPKTGATTQPGVCFQVRVIDGDVEVMR